jgi:hypothetical protein
VTLTLRLSYPEGVRILSFTPEAALGKLALLGRSGAPPAREADGRLVETRVLKVTVYDVGGFEIPAFEASYEDARGRPGTAATRPMPLTVASVLPAGDERPADIKGPAAMSQRPVWPWVLAALLAAGALGIWLWRRRRRPQAAPAAPAAPPVPPDERAYAELGRLLASGLLERGQVKEFYIELAEILRRYLEGRFAVDTFERTTSEILEALRVARLHLKVTSATAELLGACDLVKFAKYAPRPDETRGTVERAYRLIDETRPAGERPVAAGTAGARAAGAAP